MTGTELRNARIRRGLLQKQLARLIGLHEGMIGAYERGVNPITPVRERQLLAALKLGAKVQAAAGLCKDVDFSTDEPTPEFFE